VSWAVSSLLVVLWAGLRLFIFNTVVFPLTYALPLLVCVWTRDRIALWAMAAAFVVFHTIKLFWILPDDFFPDHGRPALYAATLLNIAFGAAIVHAIIGLRERLEASLDRIQKQAETLAEQNDELTQQAEELSVQSEELAQQRDELSQHVEELAQQNEELEAQSLEIQRLNSDLGGRENLLQLLLDAARNAATERAALQHICEAACRMFGEGIALAAAHERRGGRLSTRASACAGGAQTVVLDPESTFAGFVIDENRTAALDDAAVRPDLTLAHIPGQESLASVLGAPMRMGTEAFGAFVVYGVEARAWTQQDFALVEWMARQAASILQLLRLQEMLHETDRRKNEFLATLSHELRNPLAPIRYAVELLKAEPNGPGAARCREVIERQLALLVRLVDDLLDLTRITSNKIRLRNTRLALEPVVQAAVDSVLPEIQRVGHELCLELPAEPMWVDGDADRLTQVCTNLLLNAIRYTPPGGRITVSAQAEGADSMVLTVRDTGAGLRPEDQTRVFEMFTQVGDRPDGGLGIGLALVKGLVELHGGTVEARSPGLGHGSEFRVHLPRRREEASETTDAIPALRAIPPRRIVVVDDNRDSADALCALLSVAGHDVQAAYDGAFAAELVRTFRPHIGLFDIGLPGLSGYDLASQVRSTPEGERLFLIAITGWGQDEDRQRARASGFDAHLTKPADPDQLQRLIAAASARDAGHQHISGHGAWSGSES
jgi:signal transduction histidine kinase/ActR/RegA family two-component response regulator